MSSSQKLAEYDAYTEQNRPSYLRRQDTPKKRALSCGADCSRMTLLLLNFVFLIFGAALVGTATYIMNNNETFKITSKALPIGAIALGAIVMVVSLAGCCGAWKESRCLLTLYVLLLVLLIVGQVVVAAMVLADKHKVESLLSDGWNDATNDIRVDFQNKFSCCGLKDFTDRPGVPCPSPAPTSACLPKLEDEFNHNRNILGAVALAFGLVQVLGIIMACVLRSGVRETEETYDADLEDAKKVNRSYGYQALDK